jgi:cytochrome c-type biogenesis protein CcmH
MTERSRTAVALLVIGASALVVAVALLASEPSDADRAHDLASILKCPACESESIADSPSAIARDLYDLIAERVSEGWTDDDIVAFFVATYGEQVLLDPPADRRTIALWLLPVIVLVGGVFVVVARRSRVPVRDLSAEERRKLDAELRGGEEA